MGSNYIPGLTELLRTAASNPTPLFLTINTVVAILLGLLARKLYAAKFFAHSLVAFVVGLLCLVPTGAVVIALLSRFNLLHI